MKPTDSASPHRPLLKASEGREVTLTATIVRSGQTSSVIRIGANEFSIGNANLRAVSGLKEL